MEKSTMAILILFAVVALLFNPAVSSVFGGEGPCDDAIGDPSFFPKIPPFMAEQYDTDGDGQFSQEEREAAHAAILEKYDADGDGVLSRKERHAMREAAHDAFIAKYDTDGDGELSTKERDAIKADFIKRFDVDGDGKLSKEELPDRGPFGPGGRKGGFGRS